MATSEALMATGLQSLGGTHFPDPHYDHMSALMPRSIQDALRWAESSWVYNPTYKQGCQRITRFFLTQIEYLDVSDGEKENWQDFHDNSLKIFRALEEIGDDWQCYNNSFSSLFLPFRRYLRCPRCGYAADITTWNYRFQYPTFAGKCEARNSMGQPCGYTGTLGRIERPSKDDKKIRVIRWSPHFMRVVMNSFSHEFRYFYKIPENTRQSVLAGDRFMLEHTPWDFVRCIFEGRDFEFEQGKLFHGKTGTISGLPVFGWGVPHVIFALRNIYHLQVLRRHDEAIALDYIIPLRVITPAVRAARQNMDPLKHIGMAKFVAQTEWMLAKRRRDPATWNVLPFPIEYAAYGGEGRDMLPADMKQFSMKELLNGMGIPVEFYEMSLTVQGAPMMLRLMMNLWKAWPDLINDWLAWSTDIIGDFQSWDKCRMRIKPSTHADDIERRQLELQLAAAQRISMGTALSPLGMDYKDEVRKRMEETKMEAEEQRRLQEDLNNQQSQGMLSGSPSTGGLMGGTGGGGGGGGGGMASMAGASPDDLKQQAQQLASTLVQMPSHQQRRQMLSQIRSGSETLHALVKAEMTKIRTQASAAGREQLTQQ